MSRLCLTTAFPKPFFSICLFGNGGSNTCILRDFFYSRWHSTRQHFCAWVAKVPRLAARTNANEQDHRWNRWRRRTDTFLKLQAVLDQPWFGVGIYIPILDDQAHGPENLFSVRHLTTHYTVCARVELDRCHSLHAEPYCVAASRKALMGRESFWAPLFIT